MTGTRPALWVARHGDGLHPAAPNIARLQAIVQGIGAPGKNFQCFGTDGAFSAAVDPAGDVVIVGNFQRSNQVHSRSEHTDGVARFFEQRSSVGCFQ